MCVQAKLAKNVWNISQAKCYECMCKWEIHWVIWEWKHDVSLQYTTPLLTGSSTAVMVLLMVSSRLISKSWTVKTTSLVMIILFSSCVIYWDSAGNPCVCTHTWRHTKLKQCMPRRRCVGTCSFQQHMPLSALMAVWNCKINICIYVIYKYICIHTRANPVRVPPPRTGAECGGCMTPHHEPLSPKHIYVALAKIPIRQCHCPSLMSCMWKIRCPFCK